MKKRKDWPQIRIEPALYERLKETMLKQIIKSGKITSLTEYFQQVLKNGLEAEEKRLR